MGQCLCFKWAVITSGHFLCRTTCRDCGETLTSFCIWLQFEDAWTLLPCQTRYSTTHLNLPLLLVGNLSVTSNTRRPWITELRRHMSHIIILCMFPITPVTVLSTLRLPAACCSLFIFSPSSVVIMQPSWLQYFSELSPRSTFIMHAGMKWTGYEKSICANHRATTHGNVHLNVVSSSWKMWEAFDRPKVTYICALHKMEPGWRCSVHDLWVCSGRQLI